MKKTYLKTIIEMSKYTLIILLTNCMFASIMFAADNAQSQSLKDVSISVEANNLKLSELLDLLEGQTAFTFSYAKNDMPLDKRITVQSKNESLYAVLSEIARKARVNFRRVNNQIAVKPGKSLVPVLEQTSGQGITVTGRVTSSEDKEGLPGANIIVKGTTQGTVTDVDGNYKIDVPSTETVLVFSSVGFQKEEVIVGTKTVIDMVLSPDIKSLQEIVVVGYSTQQKVNLTGAVSSIQNDDIVRTKNENAINTLTGKLPGVRVVQKSSAPGAYNTTIDIRGMGTPLFVVDGVTRDQDYFARMDPQEIESISVLKDGSAAIYGLRAANGVILITTKSGTAQDGKVDITYSGNFSEQQFLSVPHGVSALDYMILRNEQTFQNFNSNYLVRQDPVFTEADMQPYINGKPSYDWMNAIFDKATPEQQHNISINGGSDKLRYFMSLSYANQVGSYKGGGYNDDKWNFRSTVDAQITNRLSARVSIGAILDETHQPTGTDWSTYKSAWLERARCPDLCKRQPTLL